MADDHITLRISKKLVGLVAFGVLVPAAFVAGIAVSGGDSDTASTTTVAPTTTIAIATPETTVLSPTTTVKKSSTPTTVKKKPVATTVPAPLSVKASYADNCPAPVPANAGVMGKMTITWTSTSAVRTYLEVQHGSTYSFQDDVTGTIFQVDLPCNNVRLVNGTYPGTPLTVAYRITVYGANGEKAQDGGTDSM